MAVWSDFYHRPSHIGRLQLIDIVVDTACFVSQRLTFGYGKNVYLGTLLCELQSKGINAESYVSLTVRRNDILYGEYTIDMLVEGWLTINIETCLHFDNHAQQLASQMVKHLDALAEDIGMIINFGSEGIDIRTIVWEPKNEAHITKKYWFAPQVRTNSNECQTKKVYNKTQTK